MAGRPGGDVLPVLIGDALRGLAFPKRMSWDAWLDDGKGAFPFGRPIRWIVALLDGVVVPFAIYELADGGEGRCRRGERNRTRGHRFLPTDVAAGGAIAVRVGSTISGRASGPRSSCWTPRSARRASARGWPRSGAPKGLDDHGLIDEWRELVEYPTVVVGRIPAEFAVAAARGARDRPRPPPEVHPAAPREVGAGRASPPSRTSTDGRGARSSGAWSGWWSPGFVTRPSSSRRT